MTSPNPPSSRRTDLSPLEYPKYIKGLPMWPAGMAPPTPNLQPPTKHKAFVDRLLDTWRLARKLNFPGGYGRALTFLVTPQSKRNYSALIGDALKNSIVASAVIWIATNFLEAPPVVARRDRNGTEQTLASHEAVDRLENPNPFYSFDELMMAALLDVSVFGDAYWLKIRDQVGRVAELWYVPQVLMEPKWEKADSFIDYYEYTPGTASPLPIAPRDVIHFSEGINPDNIRKGLSPLASLMREIYTDNEAANFTASLLSNLGIPGLIISPDASGNFIAGSDDVETTKQYFKQMFSGDRVGEPVVMGAPTQVKQFGFSPLELNLEALRRVPEERIAAVLMIPPSVLSLGAGLKNSSFTSYKESRAAAWENKLIPMQRRIARQLTQQFLKVDYPTNRDIRLKFDLTQVRVLQGDRNLLIQALDRQVRGGWMTIRMAQRLAGMPEDESQDIYLRPFNVHIDKAGELPVRVLPPNPREVGTLPEGGDTNGSRRDSNNLGSPNAPGRPEDLGG